MMMTTAIHHTHQFENPVNVVPFHFFFRRKKEKKL